MSIASRLVWMVSVPHPVSGWHHKKPTFHRSQILFVFKNRFDAIQIFTTSDRKLKKFILKNGLLMFPVKLFSSKKNRLDFFWMQKSKFESRTRMRPMPSEQKNGRYPYLEWWKMLVSLSPVLSLALSFTHTHTLSLSFSLLPLYLWMYVVTFSVSIAFFVPQFSGWFESL